MTVFVLAGAILLWATLGHAPLRDRRQWPLLAAALLGLVLLAKGKLLLGALFVAGVALWARRPRRRVAASGGFAMGLSRTEACALLGVPADADRATILAAHRRLIARNHPDAGGTAGLAARLNAARDLLLQ